MTVYLISTIKNFVGLAADDKPTSGMPVGSRFLAADTPAEFMYVGDYYATGVLTIDAQPEASDTLLVGSTTYTFVAEEDADTALEIGIGADAAGAVANILAALAGTDGWNVANAAVTAEATAADEITVTAVDVGSDGEVDSVYTNSGAGTNAFGAATLTGGHDQWQALA